MRRTLGIAFFAGIALLIAGCDEIGDTFDGVRGSGNVITEERDVSGFNEIVVLGSGDVTVSVTGTESLTVEAEDNIMPLLTTEVRNGRLELGAKESFSATEGVKYTITAAALNGIKISGSGDVDATGIDTESFRVEISGSGDVAAGGASTHLDVGISGSGRFDGEGVVAASGEVGVSGSGTAAVNVSDNLDASVSGSGAIEYIGDPAVDSSTSGSGTISRR